MMQTNKNKKTNRAVINAFYEKIHTGMMSVTYSRREIIEGYMLGAPIDQIISKFDLHSGYSGMKVEIFKKDGEITHSNTTFIKDPGGLPNVDRKNFCRRV